MQLSPRSTGLFCVVVTCSGIADPWRSSTTNPKILNQLKIDDPYDPPRTSGTNASSLGAHKGAKAQIGRSYRILAGACATLMLLPFLAANIWSIASDGIDAYVAKKDWTDWLMFPTLLYASYIMYNIAFKGNVPGQRSDRD